MILPLRVVVVAALGALFWGQQSRAAAETPPATPPPAEPAAASSLPTLAFEKYALDNGLEVILHEDHRQPYVTVNVWYHVGAHEEEQGKTGFAHLFEHLMFQGSAHVEGDKHFKLLEEAGAAPYNGTTDFDRTNYFETLPKNELELGLWLEADRMGWLMEAMTQAKLDEQRGVVKNERLQSIEAVAYGIAEEKLWQAVFPKTHPYYGAIIGSLADLDAASLKDVSSFYDRYYAPSNATLCIVGDFDAAAVKGLIEKYFKTLPKWSKPTKKTPPAPTLTSEIIVKHTETVGTVPLVEMLWLTPAMNKPGDKELTVLAAVLGDGIASKLQEALLVHTEQAQEVSVEQLSMANVSAFIIRVVVRPGFAPEDVVNTIQSQLDYLNDVPVQPEEVARAVNQIETRQVFGLEMGFVRADVLQHHNQFDGDPGAYKKELEAYRAVTADGVMAALKTHLPKDRRAILIASPVGTPQPPPVEAPPAAEPVKEPK
ncbi:MAG: pitrilysin family protein [Deltaproteobacteria bacterium]|nr:pitrilysin family protein [Deltaproteobacteria bacterium]